MGDGISRGFRGHGGSLSGSKRGGGLDGGRVGGRSRAERVDEGR